MSNYWNLHCKTCDASSDTDINHGDDRLRGIVRMFPHIKQALKLDEDEEYIRISVAGGYSTELFSFLQAHDGHEIDLADEYGKYEPVVEASKVMSQPLTYTRFLECLDKARCGMGQVHRATTNKKTFMDLMNDIDVRHIPVNGPVQIYGIPFEIDGSLPDNAIKIDDRMYNTEGA